ncbi:hypothetical protein PFICI_01717 [Pestalotiopsis fici W106-1]|uniref:Uncharacterized protein n=1 Tax=Pestalotiopsis fici (strain W106-1 / CGMCC3.15140) TaxID=1229662 RepID=W3XPJ1_PESFW|nr:uncharacterized protein PFICI_01717 [Pestalotiopsis fici W106-1]ETS87889.1 hypothetical protein PFICI_01717 [Pestalotiopsis fici W106-1]
MASVEDYIRVNNFISTQHPLVTIDSVYNRDSSQSLHNATMKFTAAIVFAAGVLRANATAGIGLPLCLAACTPLLINPIAYAACSAGCSGLAVASDDEDIKSSPRFLDDGTVVFEKESTECADACKPLNSDPLAYSACLGGCAAVAEEKK